jgi:hypothetical protein
MDTVHVGCKSSKTCSDTVNFTVKPYSAAAPAPAIPWWLLVSGLGAAAAVVIVAAARKT